MRNKNLNEVDFEINNAVVSDNEVIVYSPAANYFIDKGSIGDFKYSVDLGMNWSNCALGVQLESDLDSIPMNTKKRKIPLVWDGADDLCILERFTNMKVKATFWDRETQTGTESGEQEYTIPEIDMRPSEDIRIIRPYPGEPNFDFLFKSLLSVIVIKTHFKIQVALEADTQFANPVFTAMSETDQTGWTYDGGAFPAVGADTSLTQAGRKNITFTHTDLNNLSAGKYNVRVLRSLHDPAGILTPTYPDNW